MVLPCCLLCFLMFCAFLLLARWVVVVPVVVAVCALVVVCFACCLVSGFPLVVYVCCL